MDSLVFPKAKSKTQAKVVHKKKQSDHRLYRYTIVLEL